MLLPPERDELLSSWIIRNSIAHGSDPMGWIYTFWGDWRAWTRDIDRYLPEEKTAALSRFSLLPPSVIGEMTLAPSVNALTGTVPSPASAWQWVIPTGKRNRSIVHGLQFCPRCLAEKHPFFPKRWRLSWYTVCPVHRIPLHAHCDTCHQPFSPHLVDYTAPFPWLCTRCGKDLRTLTASSGISVEVLHFQEKTDAVFCGILSAREIYSPWKIRDRVSFFTLLRDILILLRNMHRSQEKFVLWQQDTFGESLIFDIPSASGHTFDMLSVTARSRLLEGASRILLGTPEELARSLKQAGFMRSRLADRHFPVSETIQSVLDFLPGHRHARTKQRSNSVRKPVEPNSAEETERRMREILGYLS